MGSDYGILECGKRYRVKKAFTDDHQKVHPVGEEFVFGGDVYNHYDGFHTFEIRWPNGFPAWMFFYAGPREGEPVLDRLEDYFVRLD